MKGWREVGLHCMGSESGREFCRFQDPRIWKEDPRVLGEPVISSTDSALKLQPLAGWPSCTLPSEVACIAAPAPVLTHPWWTYTPQAGCGQAGWEGGTSLGPSPITREWTLGYWDQTRAQDLPFAQMRPSEEYHGLPETLRLTRWSRLHCDLGWGALGHTVSSRPQRSCKIEATFVRWVVCVSAPAGAEQRGSAKGVSLGGHMTCAGTHQR